MITKDYIEKGLKLGFTEEQLKSGNEYRSSIEANSLEELKYYFERPADEETKCSFANSLRDQHDGFDNPDENSSGDLLQARIRAYIYGDLELTDFDIAISASYFPMQIETVAASDQTISTPTQLGTTSGAPVVASYGTLTFNSNGQLYSNNILLNVSADDIVISSTPTLPQFSILGATGATGATGQQGTASTDGKAGTDAGDSFASSPGTNGSAGGTGTPGLRGNDGLPSLPTSITINKTLTGGLLTVSTQSGAGGIGGVGGAGYVGGNGGKGGNGYDVCCGAVFNPSNGGNGGHGGNGSNGGPGGDGIDGIGPINVMVPAVYISNVQHVGTITPPGEGGAPTNGAAGGTGGAAGSQTETDQSAATRGNDGSPGSGGNPGERGQKSGNPATINVSPL